MEARELKFFIRYLKERGLYSAFIKDARAQQDVRLHGIPFQKYIRKSPDVIFIVHDITTESNMDVFIFYDLRETDISA